MRSKTNLVVAVVIFVVMLFNQAVRAEFPICTAGNDQESPAVDGNIVVWGDYRNGNHDIYGYDLDTNTEFPVCTETGNQDYPAISGNIIVWRDNRNGNHDIYGYDLDTSTEFPICTDTSSQYYPAISGNIVVWRDNRNGSYDIYGYNLDTSTEFPICTDPNSSQYDPAVSGNIVVWRDDRNGNNDIYGYNLDTSTEFPICVDTNSQYDPAVSGNIVVWRDDRNGNKDIYGYNLGTSTEFPICTATSDQINPAIDGDIVIWQDDREGPYKVYGYDLSDDTEFSIPGVFDELWDPSIGGTIIVWIGNTDIYGYSLSRNDECINAYEVLKDVPYIDSTIGATGEDVSSCAFNDSKDLWHSFAPNVAGDYTISLCGSDFDTTLSVFEDCSLTEIACNDDFCGLQSQVDLKAKAGKNYIIRVAGYDGDSGDYTLTISGPAECINRPSSDVTGDCKVDFQDFAKMASEWLHCGLDNQSACWD